LIEIDRGPQRLAGAQEQADRIRFFAGVVELEDAADVVVPGAVGVLDVEPVVLQLVGVDVRIDADGLKAICRSC
jgi:hypothetical protein